MVITDAEFGDFSWEREFFAQHGLTLQVANTFVPEEAWALLEEADAIVTNRCPFPASVIQRLPRCQVIVRYGVGVDTGGVKAATGKGIVGCHVPD